MSTSGETADLVVKESIQITESAVKLAGLGAKNLAALLVALAKDNPKLAGKTGLKRLIQDGEELTIFSVKQEDLKGFQMESKRYPLIMRHGVHQYNFLPIHNFSTPEEVWRAVSQYAEGMQALNAHLAEDAPSVYERIRAQWALPMTTSFTSTGESQEQHVGIVTVARPMDWLHETIHFLLEREAEKDPAWTQEGMATYLSCLTGQTFEGDNYYALLTLDYNKIADSPSKTIALQLADYYHAHWFQERYDPLTYYRALGLFRQAAEDVGANDFRPIVVSCGERRNALFGGNFDEQNGNELCAISGVYVDASHIAHVKCPKYYVQTGILDPVIYAAE